MIERRSNQWIKILVGALVVPVLMAIVGTILLFGRMNAVEEKVNQKADAAVVAAQYTALLGLIQAVREDIHDLKVTRR